MVFENDVRGLKTGLPTLGMIIFAIFLIDQLKVEFLRLGLLDYQHYLAVLFGMFIALARQNFVERDSVDNVKRTVGLLRR